MALGSSDAIDGIEELQSRLQAAEETLRAIAAGHVDAVVVDGADGPEVYTLKTAAEPYRVLVEQMAQGALTVDGEGIILYCNGSFARMIGRPRERLLGTRLSDCVASASRARIAALITPSRDASHEIEFVTPTRGTVQALVAAATMPGDGGQMRCLAVTDLTDQETRQQYAAVVEAAEAAIYVLDPDLAIRTWNRGAMLQTGLTAAEAVGRNERELWPADRHDDLQDLSERCAVDRAALSTELRRPRRDGSCADLVFTLTALHDRQGQLSCYCVVAHDITSRKQAERHRELLIDELNHRVKNTLAVVQGVAHQTFSGVTSIEAARVAFEGRLGSIAGAHNLLTRENWEKVSLHDLAADAVQLQGVNQGRVTLDGREVIMEPKQAVTLAMALHELTVNAMKHGALSGPVGRVELSWRLGEAPARRLLLEWREREGPPVSPPSRRGFGSRMIEDALAHELDGRVRLDFRPEGLVCTIDSAVRVLE